MDHPEKVPKPGGRGHFPNPLGPVVVFAYFRRFSLLFFARFCLRPAARPRPPVRRTPEHARARKSGGLPAPFPALPEGFPVVTGFTQALQVSRVGEQPPVAAMGPDVVHHRGPCRSACLPQRVTVRRLTERLPQQLGLPEPRPDRQAVQAVPGCRLPPAGRWAMLLAPARPAQRPAARMPARSQGPLCHVRHLAFRGLSLARPLSPGRKKQKAPHGTP